MALTDFEKQFGGYNDLTQIPGSDIMSAGQFPDMPPESQVSRGIRLAGKGLTFGLGQRDIEAQGLGESAIEFAGSIPSTIGAVALGGPVLGAIPRVGSALAKLSPFARAMTTAGAVGGTIGSAKALQEGDITEIPKEAAWWLGGEAAGQGLMKGGAKLFGIGEEGANIHRKFRFNTADDVKPPTIGPKPMGKATIISETTAEAAAAQEVETNIAKGGAIDSILDATEPIGPPKPPTPRVGPVTMLPPPEVPPTLPVDGPKVRFVKVGDETPNFDDVPVLEFGKTSEKTTTLYRAEVGGGSGATFVSDRGLAESDAQKVGGFLKSIEIPESEVGQYLRDKKFEIPLEVQKRYGVGEEELFDRETTIKNLQKEAKASGKKLAKLQAKPKAEFELIDEFGDPTSGPMGPLTEGQAAQRSFPTPQDPNAPAFRVLPKTEPPPPPIQRPSLSAMTESVHDNPGIHENQVKPLKEVVDPTTGTTMVVPKTPQAKYAFDANRNLIRNVEPPITAPQAENLKTPLNVAKLDHGMQTEQFRTSNLLKKTDEEIEKITGAVDGTGTVKPWKTVEMTQTQASERIQTNLDRQGIPQAEMQAFVAERNAHWDSSEIPGGTANKKLWLQNEIQNFLKQRGPC